MNFVLRADRLTSLNRNAQDDLSFLDDRTQVALLAKAKADAVETISRLLAEPGTKTEPRETAKRYREASIPSRSMHSPRKLNASSSNGVQSFSLLPGASFLPVVSNNAATFADTSNIMRKAKAGTARAESPHGGASNSGKSSDTPESNPSPKDRDLVDCGASSEQNKEKNAKKQWGSRFPDAAEGTSSQRSNILRQHLDHCASAVSRPSTVIDEAKEDLQVQNSISMSSINSSLRSTKRAFINLAGAESDLDSESEMPLAHNKCPSTNLRNFRSPVKTSPQSSPPLARSLRSWLPPERSPDYSGPRTQHMNAEQFPSNKSTPDSLENSTQPLSRPPELSLKIPPGESPRFSGTESEASPSPSALSPSEVIWDIEGLDVQMVKLPARTRKETIKGNTEDDIDDSAGCETVDDLLRKWTYVPRD